ncbi:hypothetical protein HMPREF1051_0758 [Neisseria sicca VK64]|uniref:Uncharacterized protein n=1 Tax=Neisseria sicca VK64 TaxID=1095748 RepID=I2NQI1_NEISI|nr:hypothetical protein HMPREF1051_0758 [Neisseria sicca VK64]
MERGCTGRFRLFLRFYEIHTAKGRLKTGFSDDLSFFNNLLLQLRYQLPQS